MDPMSLEGDPRKPPKKKKKREEPKPKAASPAAARYTVYMRPEAEEAFLKLSGNVKEGVREIIERLKAWPNVSGARPLFGRGWAPNKFRMKTWDWRVEFVVNPAASEISIVRIGHRDTFYDEYH